MTVESVTLHGVQAYSKTSQLKQLSKTSEVCSEKCQQSQLFFPRKHSSQKYLRSSFSRGGPESTLLTGEMS